MAEYGISRTQGYYGPGGGTRTFDSGAALQQRLAEEQWGMQKDIYQRQVTGAGQMAEGIEGLVDQYNRSYGEARTANETRYQEMLGIADRTVDQRSADIQGAYGQQSSNIMQRLARQGLAGTTIAPTMRTGVEREKQAALDRSKQQLAGTRLGIMERREDEYPSSDIIMSLVNAFSQGGGGIGAGGIMEALGGMRQG